MRVIEIGTFLLPVRLSLTNLMAGTGLPAPGRDLVDAALRAEFAEFSAAPTIESEGLIIDFHRSIGARQMETMLFQGGVEVPGLGQVRLYLTCLSIGFVVTEHEVAASALVDLDQGASHETFTAAESALTDAAAELVVVWSQRVDRAIRPEWTQPRPDSAMPAGQLLWWHRVAVDPPEGSGFAAAEWFGVEVALGPRLRCQVGNGFTNIYGDAGVLVSQVVEGLMVATQEWIIVDEAQRLLAAHLTRLSRTRDDDLIDVDSQYAELLTLTEEVTLRKLILNEEQRYLANTRTKVKDAAISVWRLDDQVGELESRIAALRDLFLLHRERITHDRDEWRNRLVFVITLVALIQSVLVWYDFLTEPSTRVSAHPRPIIAVTVLGLTVLALGVAAVQQMITRRREARAIARAAGPTTRPGDRIPKGRKPRSYQTGTSTQAGKAR